MIIIILKTTTYIMCKCCICIVSGVLMGVAAWFRFGCSTFVGCCYRCGGWVGRAVVVFVSSYIYLYVLIVLLCWYVDGFGFGGLVGFGVGKMCMLVCGLVLGVV